VTVTRDCFALRAGWFQLSTGNVLAHIQSSALVDPTLLCISNHADGAVQSGEADP
jgi:hypothetical protein